jgi:hypothetical protein
MKRWATGAHFVAGRVHMAAQAAWTAYDRIPPCAFKCIWTLNVDCGRREAVRLLCRHGSDASASGYPDRGRFYRRRRHPEKRWLDHRRDDGRHAVDCNRHRPMPGGGQLGLGALSTALGIFNCGACTGSTRASGANTPGFLWWRRNPDRRNPACTTSFAPKATAPAFVSRTGRLAPAARRKSKRIL